MKQEQKETLEMNASAFNPAEGHNAVVGGFMVIMGVIFFLGMTDVSILGGSPWHLLALMPVYWIGMMAYKRYREDGRVSRRVFNMLVWGLLPFVYIGAIFLGLNVGALWPIGLIAVGICFLLFGSEK